MEKLIFINSRGESIELRNSAPFLIQTIEGLGCPQSRIVTSKAAGQDGETYHETLMEGRDIRIEIVILANSNEKLFELRRQLNRVFNPKMGEGTLTYENGYGKWNIKAASVQAPVEGEKFSTTQRMMLNLRCSNPYWRNISEIKTKIALWVGDFEFPLEILEEGIEIGHRESNLIVNVYNKGDVSCGMRIEFKALATVVNPSLFNVYTREFIKVKRTLESGDKLIITTDFANKKVELVRNGVASNVFHYIDLSSTFLQLSPGDNLLRYDAEEGIENLEVSIYHTPLYSGV